MRGTSQASKDAVLREFEPVAASAGDDGLLLAEQLFTVVDTLDSSGSLRRALTDPARPGKDKADLVRQLFAATDARVQDVVADAVHERWSDEDDLADAAEEAGRLALLAYAEDHGTLETVEEELFRVERVLDAERELRVALSNRSATKEARVSLLEGVVADKIKPVTRALLVRVVGVPRGERPVPAIQGLLRAAAERRDRSVASVTAAVELSAAQRQRLQGILEDAYGRSIQINVAVDPSVLGGIRVQVGQEVVDGTVLARLDEARRRLVG